MGTGLTDRWKVEDRAGSASELFGSTIWDGVEIPTLRVLKVRAPTIVLGSSQPSEVVDHEACRVAGIDVVRRRSGGGAVWLDDDMVWVDVFVPAGHPRWDADIGRSMWWLGDAWADALRTAGVLGVRVHKEAMVRTPWSSLVCFAGLGSGEVTIHGRKAVGISQRRTRAGALFQCGLVRQWAPERLVAAFSGLDDDERSALRTHVAESGAGLGSSTERALEAFLHSVATRLVDDPPIPRGPARSHGPANPA